MRGVLGAIRRSFDPEEVRRVGTTPDYRFSLANERTFLAWIRTGPALVAGGLATAQFLPPLPIAHLREVISVALLAATVAVLAARMAADDGNPLIVGLALAGWTALFAVALRRYRSQRAGPGPALPMFALFTAGYAALGTLLVLNS
jgi:putative membrane protein